MLSPTQSPCVSSTVMLKYASLINAANTKNALTITITASGIVHKTLGCLTIVAPATLPASNISLFQSPIPIQTGKTPNATKSDNESI